MVSSIAYCNVKAPAKATMQLQQALVRRISRGHRPRDGDTSCRSSRVSILTSVSAVGIRVEEEHDPFPDEQLFHVHDDFRRLGPFHLAVSLAALGKKVKAFPDGFVDVPTGLLCS